MGESLTARGVRTAVRWHVHGAAQNRRETVRRIAERWARRVFRRSTELAEVLPIRGRTEPFAYVGAHRQPPDRYLNPLVSRSIFTFFERTAGYSPYYLVKDHNYASSSGPFP
jgi:hypothetical protein